MTERSAERDQQPKSPVSKEEADAAKARAEARTAESQAQKAERENEEWNSDLARRRRAAEQQSAIAKADKEAATARREQLASFIPSLAGVERGETKVSGDQQLYGVALAFRALHQAAAKVAKEVKQAIQGDLSVLVTSDVALAASDASYVEVVNGLDELLATADLLLGRAPVGVPSGELETVGPGGAILGALAGSIPSVISLLSSQRSVATSATSADDLRTAASVAGALVEVDPQATVVHDDFRILPAGDLHGKLAQVREKRWALAALSVQLRQGAPEPSSEAVLRAGMVDSLVAAIDAFIASLTAVAQGATRSALTSAVLREGLHSGLFGHVLLIKGGSGSSTQVVDDRPLMLKDRFSVFATMTVTYMLVRISDSRVVSAGSVSGMSTLSGKIGDQVIVEHIS